ncbi:MAG: nucleotidyltransferase domain-containing protein [Cyanobacteria bacterium P01_A01_bin.114]
MDIDQQLLNRLRELSPDKQRAVKNYVEFLHEQNEKDIQKIEATDWAEHSPTAQIANATTAEQPIVSEAEQAQILARIYTARANRPQFLETMKVRQSQGWEAARLAAKCLKEKFGATRVVLFGSLLKHETMHETSDIDLAVWGLPGDQFFQASTAVNRSIHTYNFPPIDLVPFERAYPYIQKIITAEGIDL